METSGLRRSKGKADLSTSPSRLRETAPVEMTRSYLAGAALAGEDRVKQAVQVAGAGAQRALCLIRIAITRLQRQELVGDIDGREHRYTQRVHARALRRYRAHLRIDEVGQPFDVHGVLST